MADFTQIAITQLEKAYGDRWQVWVVYRYIGGPVYCAKRWDGTGEVINADTPERLSECIRDAEKR